MRLTYRAAVVTLMLILLGGHVATPSITEAQESADPVAMVSGSWRLTVWQFALAPSFPEYELSPFADGQWGVLIFDVTNVGVGGELPVTDIRVGDAGDIDVSHSVQVSEGLGYAAISDQGIITVPENGIVRVALVAGLPAEASFSTIELYGQTAVVIDALSQNVDVSVLPPPQTTMQLAPGSVIGVDAPASLSVAFASGESRSVPLAGLSISSTCYRDEAMGAISELVSGGVWVETVAGVDDPTIWINDPENNTFVLLDQQLVDRGAVNLVSQQGSSTMYTHWLATRAMAAQANSAGGFGECRWTVPGYAQPIQAQARLTPTPEPTPRPTPKPRPTQQPGGSSSTAQDQSRAVAQNPDAYIGQSVKVSGIVFVIAPDGEITYLVIVDNVNSPTYAFAVAYTGRVAGIAEGERVIVTGVVMGVEDLGMGDRLPLIIATEIE